MKPKQAMLSSWGKSVLQAGFLVKCWASFTLPWVYRCPNTCELSNWTRWFISLHQCSPKTAKSVFGYSCAQLQGFAGWALLALAPQLWNMSTREKETFICRSPGSAEVSSQTPGFTCLLTAQISWGFPPPAQEQLFSAPHPNPCSARLKGNKPHPSFHCLSQRDRRLININKMASYFSGQFSHQVTEKWFSYHLYNNHHKALVNLSK